LEEHLARLERSLGALGIRNPYTREQWRAYIGGVIERQPFEDQAVYFQVTRGVAKRDHAFPKHAEPTVFMMSNPLLPPPAVPLEFRDITEGEVRAADELWVTSSSKEILAVVRLDGRPVGDARPGPVFRRMYRLYQDFKQQVMRAGRRERVSA